MIASVVLPCYNLPQGWEQIVYDNYAAFCSAAKVQVEVVVVLDGISTAATKEALDFLKNKIPGFVLIQYPVNKGKGYAIRQGMKVATGEIIIYTDVDFPYKESSLLAIFEILKNNETDIAIGVKDESYYTHVPFIRSIISRCLRFFIRLFLSTPITDTQCGLKGLKKEVVPLFLQTTINRYLFDLEFIRNAFRSKKYRINAIPIALKDNVHFRKMNYKVLFSESVNFLKLLFKR